MRLKNLLLLAACGLVPAAAVAVTDYDVTVEQTAADGTPTVFTASAVQEPLKATGENVTVTIKIEYDDSTLAKTDGSTTAALSPSTVHFYEAGGVHSFITIANLKKANYKVSIPTGYYDVFEGCTVNARFREELFEKYHGVGNMYYIKEGIEINSDTTLVIDFNEATNYIHFAPVTSKGQPFTFCTRTTNADKSVTYANDGNMLDGGVLSQMIVSGHKAETSQNFINAALAPRVNYAADSTVTNNLGYYDFLTTKCSNKFQFTNVRYGYSGADDGHKTLDVVMQTVAGCDGDTTITNSASTYVKHTENILPSVYGDQSTTHYCRASIFLKELGAIDFSASLSNTLDTLQAGDPCVANYSINDPTGYYVPRLYLSLADYIPKSGTKYFIYGPQFSINDKLEQTYTDFGPHENIMAFVYDEDAAKAVIVNRPAKGLDIPYDPSQPYTVGNNAPSMVFACASYKSTAGVPTLGITLNAMGRYGERRHSDWPTLGYEVYYNDSLCASGTAYTKLTSANSALNKKKYTTGKVKYVITDTNARFDGQPAETKVTNVIDLENADLCAPTLIYVRVHDLKRNTLDDHVTVPAETQLEIIAADRNYVYGKSYYDNQRVAEIKAYYSVHGAADWKELALTSVPENDDYLGYFYTASLAALAQQADSVLYDLKVNLKDEAGNTQEQVISPICIVIGNRSGVADVEAAHSTISAQNGCIVVSGEPTQVDVFDTYGRQVIAGASSAQPISTSQLTPGVYVVRTASATGKVVVK